MSTRTLLLATLLAVTACNPRDIDGLWTGQCVIDASYGSSDSYYGAGSFDMQYVLEIALQIERQRRDIDGSGKFQLGRASYGGGGGGYGYGGYGGDSGYYGYDGYYGGGGYYGGYGDSGRGGGNAEKFRGELDGWLKGSDIELELRMQGVLLTMEGTVDDETITGDCVAAPDPERYGGYYVSSYSSSSQLKGKLTLKRR